MELEGTVVNGVIVLDGNPPLPEGVRVRVEVESEPLPTDHPHAPYNREVELAILRQAHEEAKAGIGGVEARQFLKELALKHNLPLAPGE